MGRGARHRRSHDERTAERRGAERADPGFTRTGDVLSAGAVALGQVLALTVSTFAALNVGMTLVWIFVARQIAREHRRRTL